MRDHKGRVWLIIGLTILSLVLLAPTFLRGSLPTWWPGREIRRGLDIKGGIYLALGVETEEAVKSQITVVASALKSDLRKQKVFVQRAQATAFDTLEVLVRGEPTDANAVETYVRKNFPFLEKQDQSSDAGRVKIVFKVPELKVREIEKQAVEQAIHTVRNRVDQFGVAEPTIQQSGEKGITVQLPDVSDLSGVKETIGSVAKLEFRLVADPMKTAGSTSTIELSSREGGKETVEDEVLMYGDAIKTASVEASPTTNEIEVLLQLTSVGQKTFDQITSQHTGRRLAIVLDGVVQSAPRINERISGGTAQITGSFTPIQAKMLAIVLKSGALPASLKFNEEAVVGATLGADSIRKGIIAMLLGAASVIVFTILYYRRAGVLAVGCLVLNIAFMLALLSLFGATLTLPGIAGIALTVGMAVDSNIIIFERIREELKCGSSANASVEAGFLKAHWTILDANLTTLISAVILYSFGSGPIKGFAVTLALGVMTTMFCALYVCRAGFDVMRMRDSDGSLSI